MSPTTDWQSSPLWQHLHSAEPLASFLRLQMPDIETVLKSAGTDSKDMTLHDAGHAFRVTEWMHRIIPDAVKDRLSHFEWAMLLLSAYLHDIGMSPEAKKVQAVQNYLIHWEEEDFNGDQPELAKLKLWLAEREGLDFTPPVKSSELAAELLTYYCRDRHNDWSSQWTRNRFKDHPAALYPGWVDDLVHICASHHEGYSRLIGPDFDPTVAKGALINRRYLAGLLRVADILENDPERVPDVILQHRSVAPKSVPHWERPHFIDTDIVPLAGAVTTPGAPMRQVNIVARPDSAITEKAIRDTIGWINRELELCQRLYLEKRFDPEPATGRTGCYFWDLLPPVQERYIPRGHKYTFINGTFRPNTKRLLELLGGTQLYQDRRAAVREMLQNALDAVREQIAREMLHYGETGKQQALARGRSHLIHLTYEKREDGSTWLHCQDDGVGMTRSIIEDFLLVSGQPPNPAYVQLKVECRSKGVPLLRTGQFGIGVLSYMMLGEHWIFRTRRSAESPDSENHGWIFETWGIGSFGELREDPAPLPKGTEVSVQLRPETVAQFAAPDPSLMDHLPIARLRAYLTGLIGFSPCRIRLSCNDTGPSYYDLLIIDPAGPCMGEERSGTQGFHEICTEIDGVSLRARVPRYRIGEYESPVELESKLLVEGVGEMGHIDSRGVGVSWCGIFVQDPFSSYNFRWLSSDEVIGPIHLDIDIQEPKDRSASIHVSRQSADFSPVLQQSIHNFQLTANHDLFERFITPGQHPFIAMLSRLFGGIRLESWTDLVWAVDAHEPGMLVTASLRKLRLPLGLGGYADATWRENDLQCVHTYLSHGSPPPSAWLAVLGSPDYFAFYGSAGRPPVYITPIWTAIRPPADDPGYSIIDFPEPLSAYDGLITGGGAVFFNQQSPLTRLARQTASDLKPIANCVAAKVKPGPQAMVSYLRLKSAGGKNDYIFCSIDDAIFFAYRWSPSGMHQIAVDREMSFLDKLDAAWKIFPTSP